MIKIICVGKIKEDYLKELINDYVKRISKYSKIEIIELKDYEDIKKETKELLDAINTKDYNIALCINGKQFTSVDFSKYIDKTWLINSNITFIIGGSNGLEKEIINICNDSISFSNLTFPHGLFRGILLEQIYRSFKIINNETYHK